MSGPALLAAVAVAAGVTAQAVTGFGFSLVCAPFLIAAYRAPTEPTYNDAKGMTLPSSKT